MGSFETVHFGFLNAGPSRGHDAETAKRLQAEPSRTRSAVHVLLKSACARVRDVPRARRWEPPLCYPLADAASIRLSRHERRSAGFVRSARPRECNSFPD